MKKHAYFSDFFRTVSLALVLPSTPAQIPLDVALASLLPWEVYCSATHKPSGLGCMHKPRWFVLTRVIALAGQHASCY